jgi:hypothetical protein
MSAAGHVEGCSRAWPVVSTAAASPFGTKRSQVQILSPRPPEALFTGSRRSPGPGPQSLATSLSNKLSN